MSFVKKIIGPDETLIGISSAHWIYGLKGLAWLAFMMGCGLGMKHYAANFLMYALRGRGLETADAVGDALFWIPTALGGIMFLLYFLMMVGPEIALTSKRVIYKRGIIFTDIKEVDLEEIKAANVNNGGLGRFLNYGYVVFDARFVTGMDLPAIGKPYRFVKALNDARSHLKDDSMTVVLDGVGDAVQQAVHKEVAAQQAPPALGEPQYNDHMEQTPAAAVQGVIQESKANVRRSLKDSPLKRLTLAMKRQPEQVANDEAHADGPTVFHPEMIKKENRLKALIKRNFSATSH